MTEPAKQAEATWMQTECVLCGHGFDEHLEPNSDTPICQRCDELYELPPDLVRHYMGWPSDFVFALSNRADALQLALTTAEREREELRAQLRERLKICDYVTADECCAKRAMWANVDYEGWTYHCNDHREEWEEPFMDDDAAWLLIDALPATPPSRVETLFDAIAHGDEVHRGWLKEAIDNHFAGRPVPPPRSATPPSTEAEA